MDQYSDLAFANAIRLEPQKYIKSLLRSLSRNGSFTEYENFEKFLLENQNQLLKIFHVADQISNHGPRDESDDAISIMRKIIESEIFHEIEVFSSGSSPDWQNPKKLIGYLIVHIMVFLDPDIRPYFCANISQFYFLVQTEVVSNRPSSPEQYFTKHIANSSENWF